MAGSYNHVTNDRGGLRDNESFVNHIENLGDAYEAIEEMYGMIWWLAQGDTERIADAEDHYEDGIRLSPTAR
jgi:hypothetical protein